jgi:hypothetical protein
MTENQEWQAPLPPQDFKDPDKIPQMSLMQTLKIYAESPFHDYYYH